VKLAFCAACIALALEPAAAAETYTMDSAHCIPSFEFTHLGMTTQTGRFDRARGTVTLDRAARRGSIRYEIDAASLDMGSGTERPDSPGYRLFEIVKFPTITFRSDNLYFGDDGRVIAAQGKLTLLGVTRPLTVWVSRFACSVRAGRNFCAADVAATVTRSEFGMLQYIPAVSDEIKINVPIEAYRD
jgi:polyisoprenoid-binding protein YceI